MRSRIAIFEGYAAPFSGRRSLGRSPSMGRRPFAADDRSDLGRRSYFVAPRPARRYVPSDGRGGYGPPAPKRRGYKVRAKRNTPAMKKAMNRFSKAAKKCSRKTRNGRKGSFQVCMRRALKSKRSKR